MKAVILAGGFGTRISEETHLKPKPMIEIGGRPILWHILKIYSHFGINDFIICLGYRGYTIKEYFANYFLHMSSVTFDMHTGERYIHNNAAEPWKVTLVDTGEQTMTGGRLRRVRDYIGDETFCFTYGDGVADIPIDKLVDYHLSHGKLATVTSVQLPGRFGHLKLDQDRVVCFQEKPQGGGDWVNGGFFVLEPQAIDYVDGDASVWEREPLESLAQDGNLMAFKHRGFWQPMDTLREKKLLDNLWESQQAPWKFWIS